MPILFIDGSDDPELETWRGELLRAAAQSVSPAGAILDDDAIRDVLEKEMPGLLSMWGPVPDFEKIREKRLLNEVRERHRDRRWIRGDGSRRKAVPQRRPGR